MSDRRLIGIGIAGVVAAAVCCATPVAVLALGALGLASLVVWIDPALLVVALVGASLIGYGLYRRCRGSPAGVADKCCDDAGAKKAAIR